MVNKKESDMKRRGPDPGPPLKWDAPPSERGRNTYDIISSVALLLFGLVTLIPLEMLREHWVSLVGNALIPLPLWLIASQIVLLIAAGCVTVVLIRARKISFWVPATAAVLGTIGFSSALFLAVASLPCPSLC